jgi:hypothetical protein
MQPTYHESTDRGRLVLVYDNNNPKKRNRLNIDVRTKQEASRARRILKNFIKSNGFENNKKLEQKASRMYTLLRRFSKDGPKGIVNVGRNIPTKARRRRPAWLNNNGMKPIMNADDDTNGPTKPYTMLSTETKRIDETTKPYTMLSTETKRIDETTKPYTILATKTKQIDDDETDTILATETKQIDDDETDTEDENMAQTREIECSAMDKIMGRCGNGIRRAVEVADGMSEEEKAVVRIGKYMNALAKYGLRRLCQNMDMREWTSRVVRALDVFQRMEGNDEAAKILCDFKGFVKMNREQKPCKGYGTSERADGYPRYCHLLWKLGGEKATEMGQLDSAIIAERIRRFNPVLKKMSNEQLENFVSDVVALIIYTGNRVCDANKRPNEVKVTEFAESIYSNACASDFQLSTFDGLATDVNHILFS